MRRLMVMCCVLVLAFLACAQSVKNSVTVALTGDIMMGTVYPSVQLPPYEGRQLFVDAAPVLKRADLALGNLEGPLCDTGSVRKVGSAAKYAFRTPTNFSPRLKEAGFDFVSLANNHAFDFGLQGARSTMHSLDSLGVYYAGLKKWKEYVIVEKEGVRYGICAFGHNYYTVQHQHLRRVREIITYLTNTCDVVIVSFHGGAEGVAASRLPHSKEFFLGEDRGDLIKFAHFCVDAGADVVFGHGPHVLRAVELYKEHFIAYSLGNFCTPYAINILGTSGYAPIVELNLTLDGRFMGGRIHSYLQKKGLGPRIDPHGNAAHEIKRLTRLDVPYTPLKISEMGDIIHL